MSHGQCSCPGCGTILRIRDRSFVGRQIDCPECSAKLTIKLDAERNLIAEAVKAEPAKPAPRQAKPATEKGLPHVKRHALGFLQSPLVMAWALAIGVTAFVIIMMMRPNVRFQSPPPVAQNTAPQAPAIPSHPQQPADTVSPDGNTEPVIDMQRTVVDTTQQPSPPDQPVQTPPEPPVVDTPADPPKKPETVATPPAVVEKPAVKIDVDSLLKQRLQKFSTDRPVSRQDLLELVEEMLGAPIRYDRKELGEKNLERTMSVDLDGTTVGGVLKAVLDSAGWEFVIEEGGLRLKPRQVAGPAGK